MDDDPFLGWGLRPVELTDRDVLTPYFTSLAEPLSDYTFSQLFTWRNSLRILWKKIDEHLCVFANGTGDLTLLLPPIGDTAPASLIQQRGFNTFSYTLIPDPSQPFDNFAAVGGLNADGSINGAGDLNFFAVQGNRPLFQSGGFGPQQQWGAIPQGCYGVITSCADSGSSFKFSPLVGAPTPAPEPSTWAMMLLGFAGLGFAGYRASRRTAALG